MLIPVLYVGFPTLIAFYYQVDCMRIWVKSFSPGLYRVAQDYPIWFIVGSLLVTVAFVGWERAAGRIQAANKQGKEVLESFIQAIDNVVGLKANRFGRLAVELPKMDKQMTAGTIFKTITEPKIQIDALLGATHDVFRKLWPGVTFKLSLIRVTDGVKFKSPFFKFLPENENPRMSVEELEKDPNSAASKALIHKIVYVPDFRAELKKKKDRRYTTTEDRLLEDGSMLSYRIDHPWLRTPIYILSICADRKQCITAEHRVTFEWLLHKIEMRIVLEHSLSMLKNDV